MEQIKTIPQLLKHVKATYSKPNVLNYQKDGQWVGISVEDYLKEVEYFALGLLQLGVKKGDNVGIMAAPSPYWTIVDLAVMSIGAVSIPLFANLSEENFIFEIAQTSLKLLFIAGKDAYTMYDENHHFFETVISLEPPPKPDPRITDYHHLINMGKKVAKHYHDQYAQLQAAIQPEDLATIVYTSGSTGVPKGVELTHFNITSTLALDLFQLDCKNDRYMSILPLAHIFGRALNFSMIAWGVSIYYFNDVKNLGIACREIHPTLMVVVPRHIEKLYAKVAGDIQQADLIKRKIGQWALSLAQKEHPSVLKFLLTPLASALVYGKIRNALGGQMRIMISGGASLNPHLCHQLIEIGLPIYEGWGMTEAATVAVNRPGKRKIGTVGIPLPGMDVKIAENGEILIRGCLVTRGYYRNERATALTLDKEGWFHTGDKGHIDSDGFVTIEGRVKEIFKSSTGEYVVPVPIEQALSRNNPMIDMAMVVGEGQKYASVLLFPNFDVVRHLKIARKQTQLTDEEFLNSPEVKDEMKHLLEKINAHLNHWEQIVEYRFILHPLTVESGELTPSLKIRREIVSIKYKDAIASMYPQEAL